MMNGMLKRIGIVLSVFSMLYLTPLQVKVEAAHQAAVEEAARSPQNHAPCADICLALVRAEAACRRKPWW